jgi:hypothetical protein
MAKVNPKEVLDYLTNDKGLTESQALGIMANIRHESGFDPNVNEANPIVNGSRGGFGLFQHTGERRRALEQVDGYQDYRKQIDFALSEPEGQEFTKLQFESPRDASVWWTKKFERPANADQNAIARAKDLEGGDINDLIKKWGNRVSDKKPSNQGGNYSLEEVMAQG